MLPFRRCAAIALLGLSVAAGGATAADDPVVAIVDGVRITRGDLEAALARLPAQYRQLPLEQVYQPLLERTIESRLIVAEANRRKLADDPAVRAEIARARDDVLRDSLLKQVIDDASTPERLRAAYAAQRVQPGFAAEEVHARHILVASEDDARRVIAELDGGADFATLARSRSTDPSAKTNGGDLGYFRREAMVPAFADAAFTIPPGDVGDAPVQTQFGWHVIKVDERRVAVPTFEEKEGELREQVAGEIIERLVADARAKAKVERFELDGSPAAR